MFTANIKGVSRNFEGCFEEGSKVFQGNARELSRVFKENFKKISFKKFLIKFFLTNLLVQKNSWSKNFLGPKY